MEKDIVDLNVTWQLVEDISKDDLKKLVKTNATNVGLKALNCIHTKHKQVKHIKYNALHLQPYLRSPIIQQEKVQVINALRSKCVKTVRCNFSRMFHNRLSCPLNCNDETSQAKLTHKNIC